MIFSHFAEFHRGKPILLALVQHLLENGMKDATDVMLTGCSGKDSQKFFSLTLSNSLIQLVGWPLTCMLILYLLCYQRELTTEPWLMLGM